MMLSGVVFYLKLKQGFCPVLVLRFLLEFLVILLLEQDKEHRFPED